MKYKIFECKQVAESMSSLGLAEGETLLEITSKIYNILSFNSILYLSLNVLRFTFPEFFSEINYFKRETKDTSIFNECL